MILSKEQYFIQKSFTKLWIRIRIIFGIQELRGSKRRHGGQWTLTMEAWRRGGSKWSPEEGFIDQ
jgi:hypothetical protein